MGKCDERAMPHRRYHSGCAAGQLTNPKLLKGVNGIDSRSQGAEIVGYVGVSFLRFRFMRVLAPLCVALDSILGKILWFAPKATVTAFAFRGGI
jgi:hypothetical protein